MKTATKFYFAVGVLVICFACWQLLAGETILAAFLLALTSVIYFTPGAAFTRGYPAGRLWPRALVLIVISVVALVTRHFTFPAIGSIVSHPAFVVSLGLYLMWGLLVRWRWLGAGRLSKTGSSNVDKATL
jgi:hypothetical protein